MAATLHRPPPTASVTATQAQVTAPVLEFRCMFTHDILKKSKKWHDGSLRYHTFNKRVMVYDEAKNLVGDLHYRQPEEFGEGLELKLDRPVLVQVDEPLGQTNTDLTPLLGRQRQDGSIQSNNQSQPTRSTLSRINAANSQLKPKSIKELLGASQGRLGRAWLPTQSPFEQRQALTEVQAPPALRNLEPPTKRRRIDSEKENNLTIACEDASSHYNAHPRELTTTDHPNLTTTTLVNLSSDDEVSPVHPIPAPSASKADRRKKQSPAQTVHVTPDPAPQPIIASDKGKQLGKTKSKLVSRKKVPANPISGKKTSKRSNPAPSNPPQPSAASTTTSGRRLASCPRSCLKFASQQPRPKLMYKALLTPVARATGNCAASDGDHSQQGVSRSTPAAQRQRRTDLLDLDHFFEDSQAPSTIIPRPSNVQVTVLSQNRFRPTQAGDHDIPQKARDDAPSAAGSRADSLVGPAESNSSPSSPLFMTRTASQLSPNPTQRFDTNSDFSQTLFRLNREESLATEIEDGENVPMQCRIPSQNRQASNHHVASSSPSFIDPSLRPSHVRESASVEAATTPLLAPPPPLKDNGSVLPARENEPVRLEPVTKVKNRLFRRVQSENLPALHNRPDLMAGEEEAELDDVLASLDNPAIIKSPARAQRSPKPAAPAQLRQSTSDPTELDSNINVHDVASSPLDTDSVHDQAPRESEHTEQTHAAPSGSQQQVPAAAQADESGPWTTSEAFLLFDWWPSGRHKPDYGQTNMSTTRGTRTNHDSRTSDNSGMSMRTTSMKGKKYGTFGSARLVSQR